MHHTKIGVANEPTYPYPGYSIRTSSNEGFAWDAEAVSLMSVCISSRMAWRTLADRDGLRRFEHRWLVRAPA